MKRRTVGLIAILALGMLTPLTADSQAPAKVSRIGILAAGSFTPERARYLGVFRERLRDLGWIEDRDFTMEIRWAEGRVERLPELASELVRLQVDMIVTLRGRDPTRAAQQSTSTIPIVMMGTGDPVMAQARAYMPHVFCGSR